MTNEIKQGTYGTHMQGNVFEMNLTPGAKMTQIWQK